MYCPVCKKEFEGKFCPECGTKLIENPNAPATKGAINLNLGDANAISGGINITNTHNHIVERNKTDREIAQDNKNRYLVLCRQAYEDLVLTNEELTFLENQRLELGLSREDADSILESVRQLAMQSTMTAPLSGIAKLKLKQFSDAILKNEQDTLSKLLEGIVVLADKNANEELQYKCYLVLSTLKPEECIAKYESTASDNYWMTYWTYLAYLNTGQFNKAEELIITLTDKFSNYPEDNATVLAAAGILIQEGVEAAQDYLEMITGESSPLLQRFDEALAVVSGRMDDLSGNLGFYTTKVLKIWNESDKEAIAEAEAERAEAEELKQIIAEAKADKRFKYSDDASELIRCYDNRIKELIVPRCVKTICSRFLSGCNCLKTVILPNSLRIIEKYAFSGTAIESLVIPEGVESIEANAFSECKSLKELTLPTSLRKIGESAFSKTAIESLIIPEGVESIEKFAFYECKSLKELTLPTSLRKIGENAFDETAIESLVIPEGIESIEEDAFRKCESLKELTLPTSLRKIGKYAFVVTAIESLVIPEGVEDIGDYAFFKCYSLKELTLSSSLKKIGQRAFDDTAIKTVELPKNSTLKKEDIKNCFTYGTKIIDPQEIEAARKKAEEEARRLAEEEAARKQAEEEARRLAEEEAARKRAEEEARRLAEEEAARKKAEEEARRLAEEEAARKKAEEEARRLAEEEAARKKAEEETRRLAEEEAARKKAEEEARRLAEEEAARKKAEEKYVKAKVSICIQAIANHKTEATQNNNADNHNVVMSSIRSSNLAVMSTLVKLLKISIPEAKRMIDTLPSTIAQNIDADKAAELKKELEAIGASIIIK